MTGWTRTRAQAAPDGGRTQAAPHGGRAQVPTAVRAAAPGDARAARVDAPVDAPGAARVDAPQAVRAGVPVAARPGSGPCERVLADCRLRAATELFAHTWDPLVLAALSEGPRRRSDLLASGGGIRDKVLTEALRRLRANGLISRTSYPAAPPRVEYALTPLGASLVDGPLRALGRWSADHGEELLEAQEGAAG